MLDTFKQIAVALLFALIMAVIIYIILIIIKMFGNNKIPDLDGLNITDIDVQGDKNVNK